MRMLLKVSKQVLSFDDFMGMIDERFAPMKHYDTIEMSDGLDDGTQGILRVRLSRHREVIGVYTYILLLEDPRKIGVIPEYPHPVSFEQGMAPPTRSIPKRIGMKSSLSPGRLRWAIFFQGTLI